MNKLQTLSGAYYCILYWQIIDAHVVNTDSLILIFFLEFDTINLKQALKELVQKNSQCASPNNDSIHIVRLNETEDSVQCAIFKVLHEILHQKM